MGLISRIFGEKNPAIPLLCKDAYRITMCVSEEKLKGCSLNTNIFTVFEHKLTRICMYIHVY